MAEAPSHVAKAFFHVPVPLCPMRTTSSRLLDTVVIKSGTDYISPGGHLDDRVITSLVGQMADTKDRIQRVVLVSSGAVALGRDDQGVQKTPDETIEDKQFFASIGQPLLMAKFIERFRERGLSVAQGLLTWDNFDSRRRRSKLHRVLERSFTAQKPTIPILNENDVIADEELRLSDNDHLAYEVAKMIGAQKVVFLSKLNGVLRDLDDAGSVISTMSLGSQEWKKFVKKEADANGNGKGGMWNKCRIAELLAKRGIETVIAGSAEEDILIRILLQGENIGTKFLAAVRR
jgi:glutamate 5-kinase